MTCVCVCVWVGGDWLNLDTLSAQGEKLPSSASFCNQGLSELMRLVPPSPSSLVSDDSVASLSCGRAAT